MRYKSANSELLKDEIIFLNGENDSMKLTFLKKNVIGELKFQEPFGIRD